MTTKHNGDTHKTPTPETPAVQQYPGYRFGPGGEQRLVNNADEDKALGKGWHDAPEKAKDKDK